MGCVSLLVWAARPYIATMSTDQVTQILYLSLLATAIAGSYIVSNRGQWNKMAQQAVIWVLIFVGVISAVGMWGQVKQTVSPFQTAVSDSQISVPRGRDGHYHVTLSVNGVDVDFVIDTGASQIVLSHEDATRIGIETADLRYLGSASTANGVVRTAPVRLQNVTLGPITDRNVPAVVNQGEMDGSLLGMSYLGAFSNIEIRDNKMILTR